jgi:LPS-assembly lipoprotein
MWWRDRLAAWGRLSRPVLALAAAGFLAGCFQPLYGDHSVVGGAGLDDKLSSVNVQQIPAPKGTPESRIAVELRNNLLFAMNGGAGQTSPAYQLAIRMSTSRISTIVDVTSGRPDIENEAIDVTFTLTEMATGRVVVTGQAFARASYDIPGSEQRFARIRALRDTENRTAGVIADQIKSRLASYFVAGT